jgi:sugar O-acyltransferase (sialic acid O-acetyltransferase NeuD family)
MKKIILIGGGGHCESVIDVIEQEGRFQIAGIIDKPNLVGKRVLGYSFIGTDSDLSKLSEKYGYALVTVGQIQTPELRKRLISLAVTAKFKFPVVVSPRAYIAKDVCIGDGTVIMHDALVNVSASVGNHCIINSKALIEHNAVIEDYCHISTAAVINGGSIVRQDSFVGSNSTTKEYIEIKGFIKAGELKK